MNRGMNVKQVSLTFEVEVKGDVSAGIQPYSRRVKVSVDGDCGGLDGEFAEHMRASLCEWFDTPSVALYKPTNALDKISEFYLNGGMNTADPSTCTQRIVLSVKNSNQ